MKINNFRGDLTGVSAKKKALVPAGLAVDRLRSRAAWGFVYTFHLDDVIIDVHVISSLRGGWGYGLPSLSVFQRLLLQSPIVISPGLVLPPLAGVPAAVLLFSKLNSTKSPYRAQIWCC